MRLVAVTLLSVLAACTAPAVVGPPAPAQDEGVRANADERSFELAAATLQAMGGREAWEATRVVRWRFFGRRLHYWDRHSGDVRIEIPATEQDGGLVQPEVLLLMNIETKRGRAWEGGEAVEDETRLAELLGRGHEAWVNDSYWMFMPYKLLDPGVTLAYAGERALADGRMADVLDMTFDEVGYTPENRYEVYIASDSGLVEQWSFFATRDEKEPRFTAPWEGWETFGRIKLATGRGRGLNWEIAVLDDVDPAVFTDPRPVGG